jgi:glutamate-1-semialdehyde aminotransferase
MAKQIKPRYPADREKQSQAFVNGLVSVSIYTTDPGVQIFIKGDHSDEVVNDLQNAVDEVLNHHQK